MHSARYMIHEDYDKIVVFIHGFMGSPKQFKDLMEMVYNKGFSAVSLLLPGHGESGFAFAKSSLKSWEKHIESQISGLDKYKKIYLVGHSLGGLLALNASLQFDLAGVVLMSSPLKLNFFNSVLNLKKIRLLFKRVEDDIYRAYKNANSIGRPYFISIPFWFRVLLQPHKLIRKTKTNLSRITTPTLVIHSESDETISVKSSALFDELLVNSEHEILLLKDSWHAYFTEKEKAIIRQKISDFISF